MLVDRWRGETSEETISVANTLTAPWQAALTMITFVAQALIGGVSIMAIQDPVFTWLAYPPATPNLPNNAVYLVVSQWFRFHAWGVGMNAWLMFYLRLSRDGAGKLELNVVEMDRYVAPALVGASQLENAIDGAKAGLMSALSGASFLFLNVLAKKYCDEVYLLPGKQPNSRTAQDSLVLEDALSDTTIVLVNPR